MPLQFWKLYDMVGGSAVKPTEAPEIAAWLQKDAKEHSFSVTWLASKIMKVTEYEL